MTAVLVTHAAVQAVWAVRHPKGVPTTEVTSGAVGRELTQIKAELQAAVQHLMVRISSPGPRREPSPVICAHCAEGVGRLPLTARQRTLLDYLSRRIAEDGYAPSHQEIARFLGVRSVSTVYEHLASLQRKGWILKRYNETRSITVVGSAA
jgi:DNA-binding CsgD family transcriptional regulator